MEDDLNYFEIGRQPNFFENGRRPHVFENDRQPFFVNRRFQKIIKKIMQPETLQIKTMAVAPLRVT